MAEAYIEKVEKRLAKTTDRARQPNGTPKSERTIAAEVRRLVWERDQGQCSWVGPDGHRCGARRRLNYDHIIPRAQGGPSTVETIRLLCAAHNQHHADQTYGREFMEAKRRSITNDVMGDSNADNEPVSEFAIDPRQSQFDFT